MADCPLIFVFDGTMLLNAHFSLITDACDVWYLVVILNKYTHLFASLLVDSVETDQRIEEHSVCDL